MIDIEVQRARWQCARDHLRLLDPESDDFATGGLARWGPDVRVRLLILPSDPDAMLLEFDEPFWAWWLQGHKDPFGDSFTTWLAQHQPTAAAAVRYGHGPHWQWDQYLTLHRSGALELGLSSAAVTETEQRSYFHLVPIVGRAWTSLLLYRHAIEHWSLVGPWQVALALRGTQDALLGGLARGWTDPDITRMSGRRAPRCGSPGLLGLWEVEQWPETDDEIRQLAFRLVAWIEDAWGVTERRYLIGQGESAGTFDIGRYRQG